PRPPGQRRPLQGHGGHRRRRGHHLRLPQLPPRPAPHRPRRVPPRRPADLEARHPLPQLGAAPPLRLHLPPPGHLALGKPAPAPPLVPSAWERLPRSNAYKCCEGFDYAAVSRPLLPQDRAFPRTQSGGPHFATDVASHIENRTFVASLEPYASRLGVAVHDDL